MKKQSRAAKAEPKKQEVSFVEGVHMVRNGQKFGVNNSEKVLLPPVFDAIFPVNEGFLAIEQGKGKKFVSHDGDIFDVSDETRENIVIRISGATGDGFRLVRKEKK